jgi:predicted small lipoprotein YifL
MTIKTLTIILLLFISYGCGKIGPLALSEDTLDKSIISYPCDVTCMENFEAEKKRQQSVVLQTD